MATVENTTVKIYKGVPLIKGGTEVLYLAQAQAEAALSGFLYKTYTEYYYTRENRGAIQVKDTIDNVEGINYVSFVNTSHGNKIYFAFVDRLVYINDNNTEIQFTIDPFPTYLGDTQQAELVYLVRNSPRSDIASVGGDYQPDYLPPTINYRFGTIQRRTFNAKYGVCYFVAPTAQGAPIKDLNGNATGLQVGRLDNAAIQAILQDGGQIIGAYILPDELYDPANFVIAKDLGTISGNPHTIFSDIANAAYGKTKSGVYNKIVLRTSQGSKQYDLEHFAQPLSGNIEFGVVGLLAPSPSIFIYPKNYCNVNQNLAEGIMMNLPAVPIATNATYTNRQTYNDIMDSVLMTAGGALGGAMKGGTIGGIPMAFAGAALGFASSIPSIAKNVMNTVLQAPSIVSQGSPTISVSGTLEANLQVVSPDSEDVKSIERYFSYYGYHMDKETNIPNLEDGAYIQTGSEFLFGSEVDLELNSRLMDGIKIRKSFT